MKPGICRIWISTRVDQSDSSPQHHKSIKHLSTTEIKSKRNSCHSMNLWNHLRYWSVEIYCSEIYGQRFRLSTFLLKYIWKFTTREVAEVSESADIQVRKSKQSKEVKSNAERTKLALRREKTLEWCGGFRFLDVAFWIQFSLNLQVLKP